MVVLAVFSDITVKLLILLCKINKNIPAMNNVNSTKNQKRSLREMKMREL